MFQSIYSGHFKIDVALKKQSVSLYIKNEKHLFILKSDQIAYNLRSQGTNHKTFGQRII
jgi:hypothetical protein